MLLLLLVSQALADGPCGSMHPDAVATIPLLEGRLRITLPGVTEQRPFPHGVLTAPPAAEERAFWMIDGGAVRVGMVVDETYRSESAETAEIALRARLGGAAVEPIGAGDRIRVWAGRPLGASTEPGADVVALGATVQMPEGTWVNLSFRLDPGNEAWAEGCEMVMREALATLAPGPKTLDLDGGGWVYPIGQRAFALQLAAGVVARVAHGEDFELIRLSFVAPKDVAVGEAFIYLGDHPHDAQPSEGVHAKGRWIGGRGVWSIVSGCKSNADCALERIQSLTVDGTEGWPRFAHAAITGSTPAVTRLLLDTVESARWMDAESVPEEKVRMRFGPL